jgi:hypothetical protein
MVMRGEEIFFLTSFLSPQQVLWKNKDATIEDCTMSAQVARSNLLGHTIYLSVEKFKHTQGK